MMKKLVYYFSLAMYTINMSVAQQQIEIADNSFKLKGYGESLFYYGFAQGDQLIFSLEELNGDDISQVEVTEYPSNSKFMSYKVKKIDRKVINIGQKAIYCFKIKNNHFFGRVCKLQIQRIPAATNVQLFNSSVYWRTVQDTIFTKTAKQYLVKSDTVVQTIVDKTIKITTSTPLSPHLDKELVEFNLPNGTYSWSYYIGVGNEGQKLFSKSKSGFLNTAASAASQIPAFGSMAALALYGINAFQLIQGEDNVKYVFINDSKNANLFLTGQSYKYYQQANVLSDASQMKSPLSGKVYLGLKNDNLIEAIAVKINITAVVIHQKWGLIPAEVNRVISRVEPYLK